MPPYIDTFGIDKIIKDIDSAKIDYIILSPRSLDEYSDGYVMCAINPDGISIEEIMGSVLGIIFTVAMYIGIILAVWGLFQLVMSLKNDDAEAKSRATQLMVVGIVLIGLKGLASVLLSKIGITVVMPS